MLPLHRVSASKIKKEQRWPEEKKIKRRDVRAEKDKYTFQLPVRGHKTQSCTNRRRIQTECWRRRQNDSQIFHLECLHGLSSLFPLWRPPQICSHFLSQNFHPMVFHPMTPPHSADLWSLSQPKQYALLILVVQLNNESFLSPHSFPSAPSFKLTCRKRNNFDPSHNYYT